MTLVTDADPGTLTSVNDDAFDGRPVTKGFDLSGNIKLATASDSDLKKINAYALKPLTAEEVAVYETKLANNKIDRDGERFHEDLLSDFAESIAGKSLLIAHQWGPPGVGRFFKGTLVGDPNPSGTIWVKASFYLLRDGNETLLKNIDAGIVWAMSIGFIAPNRVMMRKETGEPLYMEYRRGANGEKGEAIEGSMVFLGAQFDAAIAKDLHQQVARKSLEVWAQTHPCQEEKLVLEGKGAIPYRHYPNLDEGASWDGAAARARVARWASSDGSGDKATINWAKYGAAFTWVNDEDRENVGAYKLPHHDVVDGGLRTNWRGLVAAMVAVLGGRGGLQVEGDRKAVYNHLARHYRDFEKEPPEFKTYTEAELVEIAGSEHKSLVAAVVEALSAFFGSGQKTEHGTMPPHNGECPEGYMMGEDGMCHLKKKDAPAAPAQKTGKEPEEDAMTPEQIAALKAELVAEFKALLAPVTQAVEAVSTKVATLEAKSAEFAEGYKEDIEEVAGSIEKLMGRLEGVESVFAAPKGAGEGDGGNGDGKNKKSVWAGSIMPAEFKRAAGAK